MEISEFLTNLSHVASSPFAFAAYIAVVAAWVYTTVARHRLSKIANLLKELPPKERTQLILREYSSAPRSGLSAEQWIKSRQHLLLFLAFLSLVVCLTLVVIIALVGSVTRNGAGAKGTESNEIMAGTQRVQAEQILDLERKVQALMAQAAKLNADIPSPQAAIADPRLVALMQELYRKYDVPDANIELILSDPSLSVEQKITLTRNSLVRKIDQDVEDQAKRVNRLQSASAQKSPLIDDKTIDAETMKLKRVIDQRAQMFDLLDQIIDKYNKTAEEINRNISPPPPHSAGSLPATPPLGEHRVGPTRD